MKDIGIIKGSEGQAKELIVGTDTVYVHSDIEPVTTDAEGNEVSGLYQYHEVQYGKDEYIQLMSEKNASLETEITSAQEALCAVYELLG